MRGGGRLAGHVAIVTGGSRGIGSATTRLLVDEGARVLIADVRDQQGERLARDLGARRAAFFHLDVRSSSRWDAAVRACQDLFGPPGILVHNAGAMVAASIEEATEEQYRLAFDVNMLGPFLGTRAVVPAMRRAGGGAIVVVSSAGGLEGTPGMSLYAASKAANANFTRSAALELASDGIRVNAVAPGLVDTDMSRAVVPPPAGEAAAPAGVPRVGRAEDVAHAVLYLVDEGARFVSGTVLTVDGGYLAGHSAPAAPVHAAGPSRPPAPHGPSAHTSPGKGATMKIHLGNLTLTSSAFQHGRRIPDRYAAGDDPVAPPLAWTGAPQGTASFALVVHDPDAPLTHGFTHRVLYNIPADATELTDATPATAGVNTAGGDGYVPPAPPPGHGDHFYYFELYALDADLALPAGLGRAELLARIDDHIVEQARVVGTYSN
ncbi:hypothetical protein GCM10018793_56450 [Streptomyces sulfonofaciens]|uniref:3-alpha-hydroxysteroid dehydrogenase n=1 Tax=Streptomyces sulfonofaciens TaxID=68272 RepID=A0A919GK26_9ACTN|nr:glucose 1-dehydrogenase [Streptomyces sulfonofaciens]GHH86044.1 hypothetical protein GCM10018793_56450 [Streptomyces sulfonofaciens]